MDENTQILDVTYGNFACRLEGFEDSVETMKTVVAYFHDLAGHDRFMDMEPQAPDMATLARLTEEQTGVPVDIEGEGNQVSLRVRQEDVADAPDDMADADLDTAAEALSEEDLAVEEETTAEFQTNVADKLQRLRDVTLRTAPAVSDDFSEDLNDAAEAAPAMNPLSQRLSELANRSSDADVADETEEDAAEIAASDDIGAEDDAHEDDAFNVFSDLSEDETTVEAALETVEETIAEDTGEQDVGDQDTYDAEMAADEELAEAMADDEDIAELEDVAEEDVLAEHDDATDADVVAADDEAAIDSEESIEASDDTAEALDDVMADEQPAVDEVSEDAIEDAAAPLVLTPANETAGDEEPESDDYNDDDEFDLEAEVAKVEAELAAREGNEFARPGLPRHVEDAMSRIMSQTDQHLNQPENRRHRDAFAQLKAAVAATEAARQLGDSGADKRDPDAVYKDDLGAHEEAKDEQKPKSTPPLKLVKSQEVKPASAHLKQAPASPTMDGAAERLRQIATKKEDDTTEDAGGFAAFVASHGATDLVDQMEAAGAYICFVEGEDDFSRPQVMKVVQSASSTEISREDGLRSFGRLLRQARLIKQANGRFQVADNTQYRPSGSQAAQG